MEPSSGYVPPSRLSRLCVVSLILSFTCPLFLLGRVVSVDRPAAFLPAGCSALSSVIAIVRVRESHGLKHRALVAAGALGISICWAVFVLTLSIVAQRVGMPRPD